MGISFRPSAFTAGGGLVDDADLTVVRSRFTMTDYGGKSDSGEVLVLQVKLVDDEGTEFEQLYSAGTGFVPSETGDEDENGKTITPIGEKTAPAGGSNFAFFITALVNAGFPEDLLDGDDISVLEGLKAHWNRVPQPKRTNLPTRGQQDNAREKTILVCTNIISLPGETPAKAPAKTAAKPGAKPTTAPSKAVAGKTAAKPAAAEPDVDLQDELATILVGAFAEQGLTEVTKVKVAQLVFKGAADHANKKELVAMSSKADVLSSLEGFEFDGSKLRLAE